MKIRATLYTLIVSFLLVSASYPLIVESFEAIVKKETNRSVEKLGIVSPTDIQDVGVKGVGREPIILALNCPYPPSPPLPPKPAWCTGIWKLVLNCDQL